MRARSPLAVAVAKALGAAPADAADATGDDALRDAVGADAQDAPAEAGDGAVASAYRAAVLQDAPSAYFRLLQSTGTLDELAIYPAPLATARVAAHYHAAGY